jgi:hypothetical protein
MKKRPFDSYPEFINTDPRIDRTHTYSVDADFMHNRHSAFFNMKLKNKKILDLGSCVGATGAWVLDKGASLYHGVELDANIARISEKNLSKYFLNWKIANTDIESYLSSNSLRYDIVVASGVLFSLFDPIPFLSNIAKITDCLIIDSVHPKCFADSMITDDLMESIPLITFRSDQAMTWEKEMFEYPGSNPSLGFLKFYLSILGFEYQSECYEQLKRDCPTLYHNRERYGCRFIRTSTPKLTGFVNKLNADNKKTTQR